MVDEAFRNNDNKVRKETNCIVVLFLHVSIYRTKVIKVIEKDDYGKVEEVEIGFEDDYV